jgi:hypothetical protein
MIKLYTKKTSIKSSNNIALFINLSPLKVSAKNVEKTLNKKPIKNKISKPIKLIGLDLFKKLASIVSFVIFAAVKIIKL